MNVAELIEELRHHSPDMEVKALGGGTWYEPILTVQSEGDIVLLEVTE